MGLSERPELAVLQHLIPRTQEVLNASAAPGLRMGTTSNMEYMTCCAWSCLNGISDLYDEMKAYG